jgi:hypothetical protein
VTTVLQRVRNNRTLTGKYVTYSEAAGHAWLCGIDYGGDGITSDSVADNHTVDAHWPGHASNDRINAVIALAEQALNEDVIETSSLIREARLERVIDSQWRLAGFRLLITTVAGLQVVSPRRWPSDLCTDERGMHGALNVLWTVAADIHHMTQTLAGTSDAPDRPARSERLLNDRARRLVGELRTLLRDWTEHGDSTLVTLTQDLLEHYGFWEDGDADAAAARRATFNATIDKDDRAYDGWSAEPQKRQLTARERDILCRILRDCINHHQGPLSSDGIGRLLGGESRVAVDHQEIEQLQNLRWVLDPRHG